MAFGINDRSWPNATIPYEIDAGDFPVGSVERRAIQAAIDEWNDNTVIRLVPRVDERDYILIDDTGTFCRSPVGRQGGQQLASCDLESALFDAGSIMHEIGHAVGLFHEHKRPDRGAFVQVGNTSDAVNCAIDNDGRLLTDYDCGSIMHYSAGASGTCAIALIPKGCTQVGQRTRLSGRDVWGASLLHDVPMHSVVVWEDTSGGNEEVHKSGFAASGRRCSGPVVVNGRTSGTQRRPEVGMSGERHMVFVWEDDTDGNGVFQIKARGFRATGRQMFSQRTVNVVASGQQHRPDLAVANDGRFVVVWEDDKDRNGFFQIRMRGFDANGGERFSDRRANSESAGQQVNAQVAIAPDGFFVVVWESDTNSDGLADVKMRGFNHDGTERWPERRVSTRAKGDQRRPRIAMGPWGDFAVVWEDDRDGNKWYQIHMRGFDANGNEKFGQRVANREARGQQFDPDVAVDESFRPVVVWADDRDKNGFFQIRVRGFNGDGSVRFEERVVNTDHDGQQFRPRICMEPNGRFVVAWEDDKDKDGVFDVLIRGFHTNGNEAFATRHVSNVSGSNKRRPSIAAPAMHVFDPINPF